ncbi:MAG: aldo/keto reductase [Clostridia bacterium]|nr:aldo/keto reductase [Clostridia bacterium]
METIRLPGSDLVVSRLCIGGCPAGEHGWGNVSREEIHAAFHKAIDLSVNFFDTADVYGLGRSEETLGEVIRGCRSRVVVATKFGVRVENGKTFYDNSPEWIETAVSRSLAHLKTDYIDLYQVHDLDGVTPIDELMDKLLSLKRHGRIRAIGLSNLAAKDVEKFVPYRKEIASFQNHFSLAHRVDETFIRDTQKTLDAAPLTWGSLGQGILTGKYSKDVAFTPDDRRSRAVYDNFYGEKLLKNLRIVDAMRPMAQKYGVPVSAVAVRWILDALPASVVMTGVKSERQAEQNAQALSFRLTAEETAALEACSR